VILVQSLLSFVFGKIVLLENEDAYVWPCTFYLDRHNNTWRLLMWIWLYTLDNSSNSDSDHMWSFSLHATIPTNQLHALIISFSTVCRLFTRGLVRRQDTASMEGVVCIIVQSTTCQNSRIRRCALRRVAFSPFAPVYIFIGTNRRKANIWCLTESTGRNRTRVVVTTSKPWPNYRQRPRSQRDPLDWFTL